MNSPTMKKKRTLALLLLVSISTVCLAQNWCADIGTRWRHTWLDAEMYGSLEMTYVGDSTIEGLEVQKLAVMRRGWVGDIIDTIDMPPYFTTKGDDMVRIWNGSAMDTVFMLGRPVGAGWNLPFMSGAARAVVQDTVPFEWEGHVFRATRVLFNISGVPFSTRYIERWGDAGGFLDPSYHFLPQPDPPVGSLLCYTDAEIAYTPLDPSSISCALQTGVEDLRLPHASMRLVPNPGNGPVRLELPDDLRAGRLQLIDLRGRVALETHVAADVPLDASALQCGLYIAQFTAPDGRQARCKWVRE